LLILPLLFFIALPIDDVLATSGACSWHGGVNCAAGADWDGSVICNDGWRNSSVSYYSMVKCQGSYDYPSYSPSIPDCPFNSYYDSISGSCKCYSGYVASGGKCISADQYCRDLYGFNARHNILTDSCECSYGYVFSGNRCVNGDIHCRGKYGIHSSYNSLSESCKCDYGYVFNSSDQCVSKDDYCQGLYGYYSEYDILTSGCVCKDGYGLKGSTCVKIKPVIYSFSPTTIRAGETVTVSGNNFGEYKGNLILNTLSFGTLGRISSLNIKSWSNNIIKFIVPETKEPDQYYIRVEPSLIFSSEEAVSSSRLELLMPLPEIFSILSLEAEIGEEVTIRGENFGDSKYEDLNLYIGNIKIGSWDITSWWDNRIVFEVTDGLESGYIILKDNNLFNSVVVQGPYLEVLEPEEDYIPFYFFEAAQESQQDSQPDFQLKPQSSEGPQLESESESQLEQGFTSSSQEETQIETQQELQSDNEELQPSNLQSLGEEKQEEIENEQEQKGSVRMFLANIFTAVKNFFYRIFH